MTTAVALALLAACSAVAPHLAGPVATELTEDPTMRKSADRRAPLKVAPVELRGVRYEQVMNARNYGFDAETGYLRAVRIATGEELWVRRVYTSAIDPTKETDVQLRYFADMWVSPDGSRIMIRNEANETWSVDPETGASEQAK